MSDSTPFTLGCSSCVLLLAVARLVGRHSNQCINRWTKSLRPGMKKGKWSAEEDDALKAAVESCGMVWKLVAPRVKGRTDAQCRERWVNILDPKVLPQTVWSEEVRRFFDFFLGPGLFLEFLSDYITDQSFFFFFGGGRCRRKN